MWNALNTKYKIIQGGHMMFFHWVATICDQLTLKLFKDKQQIPTEITIVIVYSPVASALLTIL